MIIAEIYFPPLSRRLENCLDRLYERLRPIYLGAGGASRQVHNWLSKSLIGRFYSDYWYKLLLFYALPIMAIVLVFEEQFEAASEWIRNGFAIVFGLPAIAILFLGVPLSLYIYLYPLFFVIFKIISLVTYLVAKFIWLANFVGKGKALSGIGLLLALNDVLEKFW